MSRKGPLLPLEPRAEAACRLRVVFLMMIAVDF